MCFVTLNKNLNVDSKVVYIILFFYGNFPISNDLRIITSFKETKFYIIPELFTKTAIIPPKELLFF